METANSVINDALTEILVQASESPLEPDEVQSALRYMNRFMASLAAKGVNLGYTVVDGLSDPITIPDGALEGLVFSLAERLAPQFDRTNITQSQTFRDNKKDALHAMYSLSVQIRPAQYPGILPIGSGNESEPWQREHFYPEINEEILTEQTGSILLESGTVDSDE